MLYLGVRLLQLSFRACWEENTPPAVTSNKYARKVRRVITFIILFALTELDFWISNSNLHTCEYKKTEICIVMSLWIYNVFTKSVEHFILEVWFMVLLVTASRTKWQMVLIIIIDECIFHFVEFEQISMLCCENTAE